MVRVQLDEAPPPGVRQGPGTCDSHLASGNATKRLGMSAGSKTHQGGSSSKASGPDETGPGMDSLGTDGTEFSGQPEPRQV